MLRFLRNASIFRDYRFLAAQGKSERLDRAKVMRFTSDAIPFSRQRREGHLRHGIVCDGHAPVGYHAGKRQSFKSRSMTARRSAISSALVSCSTSQAFFSQSLKPTVIPDQKEFFLLYNTSQEMMTMHEF